MPRCQNRAARVQRCGERRPPGNAPRAGAALRRVPVRELKASLARLCSETVRIGTAPTFALCVRFQRIGTACCCGVLRRATWRRRIKMKQMKPSLIASTFLLGLLIAGCSTTPAAGPQGPPGPQGAPGYDRDRDRDRDADHDRQDQGRDDRTQPCPAGEHRDTDRGCVRN